MADQSDVETALVDVAAAALYPNGSAAASVTGTSIRLYRGWPSNAALEADLAAGLAHVSVAATDFADSTVSAFPLVWEYPQMVVPSLTIAVVGTQAVLGGSALPNQVAGLLVDDAAFAYRTRDGDTPELVAASLATLVAQVRAATSAGTTVSLPAADRLIGRVVADQAAIMQTRRQRAGFGLTCWCGDPAARDHLASTIDGAFALSPFLPLSDGSVGRLRPLHSEVVDDLSTLPLFRRRLTYSVEYATTLSQTQPSMLFGLFGVAGSTSGLRIS